MTLAVAIVAVMASIQQGCADDKPISVAATPSRTSGAPTADDGATGDQVARDEAQLSSRYKRLEEMFLRLAEVTGATDPGQADLLRKAMVESKQRLIAIQFEQIVERLERERLGDALAAQKRLREDLNALLELLLSDVRADRLNEQQQRVAEWLKQLDDLISRQQSLRGLTERSADAPKLAGDQQRLAEETERLREGMDEQPGADSEPGEPTPAGDRERQAEAPGDQGEKREKSNANDESEEGEPGESGDASESSPDEPNEPGEGSESSKSAESGDSSSAPADEDGSSEAESGGESGESSPSQQRLSEARRRMRQAREQLERAQRDDAVKEQNEALRQLEQAKAELEEMLRQLREEEIAQMLAMLEAHFRRMLQEQGEIYESTVQLDEKQNERPSASDRVAAARLSERESQLAETASLVLRTLRDDGSATALPEAVEQVRDDMQQVAGLMSRYETGGYTQSVEQDIIASLEELIEAVMQAQDDQEKRQQRQQQGSSSQSGGQRAEAPLVDKLAELRMIRSLQMRVNRRTLQLDERAARPDTPPDAIDEALEELGQRELRIIRATQAIAEEVEQ